jgi:hypothetical protein
MSTSWRHAPGWAVDIAAVVAWAATLPLALAAPTWSAMDPFTVQGQTVGYAVAFTVAAVLLALWLVSRAELLVGVAAGAAASCAAVFVQLNLTGTPFGYGGVTADVGRFTALAGRYTVTTASADAFIPGAPSEYPPLVPLLIGKAAVLLDRPAWQVMGPAEAVLFSLAIVVSFLLWRRIAPPFVALVLATLPLVVQPDPRKAFQLLVLAALAPWAITTLARRPTAVRRLGWLAGGLVGGLLVLTYPGYVVFVAPGILALVVYRLTRPHGRGHYLRHLLLVGVVAAITVSWYVVPFITGRSRFVTGSVTDQFASPTPVLDPTGFLSPDPFPPIYSALFVAGITALAFWGTRVGWARALGLLLVGAVAYRLWRLDIYAASGSTGFLQYVGTVITALVLSAGVLGIWRAGRAMPRLVGRGFPATTVAFVVTGAVIASLTSMQSALRLPISPTDEGGSAYTVEAHTQRLPDCSRTEFGEPSTSCFPAASVRSVVTATLGPDALPVTLSDDERIFAFYPWYAFVTNDRTSAGLFQAFDSRVPALRDLASITTPGELDRAMASTPFGPLDVLVLQSRGDRLAWTPAPPTEPVEFDRAAFQGPEFTVIDVGRSTTVVVRNAADPARASYPV